VEEEGEQSKEKDVMGDGAENVRGEEEEEWRGWS
jgi:hypothetical protein